MRQISNFLLFEGLLDNVPSGSSSISSLAKILTSPLVTIVEDDCNTYLGEYANVDLDREGDIASDTKIPLTFTRIQSLMQAGTTKIFVRKSYRCTSKGGICKLCYQGTYPFSPTPTLTSKVQILPEFVGSFGVFVGTGSETTFALPVSTFTPTRVELLLDGVRITTGYTVDQQNNVLVFDTAPAINSLYLMKAYTKNSDGLLNYFSKTFSSSLFGIKEVAALPMILSETNLEALIPDNLVEAAFRELNTLQVPSTMISYYSQISSKLERAIYVIYLYTLYAFVLN